MPAVALAVAVSTVVEPETLQHGEGNHEEASRKASKDVGSS